MHTEQASKSQFSTDITCNQIMHAEQVFKSKFNTDITCSQIMHAEQALRLLAHVRFLRQDALILSEVIFCVWKGARISKKICHNRAKKIIFLRGSDRKNTLF